VRVIAMIELQMYMNSSITEIMEWKCCNISGLNLELIFFNAGEEAVPAPSWFILEGGAGNTKVETIYPPWPQKILPRDYTSIYCSMDEAVWKRYDTLYIKLKSGQEYRYPIDHSSY